MIYHNNKIEIDIITLKVGDAIYKSERTSLSFLFGETKLDRMNNTYIPRYGTLEKYNLYFLRNKTNLNRCSIVSHPVYVYYDWVEKPSADNDPEHFKIAVVNMNGTIEFLYPNQSIGKITFNSY